MKTEQSPAQINLTKLPAQCFGRVLGNPVGERISIIRAGESGYYKTSEPASFRRLTDDQLDAEIDRMNAEDGITRRQRNAMENGSMFGWECASADPTHKVNG